MSPEDDGGATGVRSTLHRLTFDASHSCALCHGGRFGEVLRRVQLCADLEGETLVEATFWVCAACVGDNARNLGGWVLRRTLFRWRDSLSPTSLVDREGDKGE